MTHYTNPQVTAQRGPLTSKDQTNQRMLSLCKCHSSHPEGARYCALFLGRPDHAGTPERDQACMAGTDTLDT